MPPDATETKRRILAAAHAEFAEYGLAGARVDRIAESASANKRSIYVHFGPKETLFDIVIEQTIAQLEVEVPFTADDLPGYGGRLFDFIVAHPLLGRLSVWAQLERAEATTVETAAYAAKVAALAALGDAGAVDTLALVLGLVTSWFMASPALRAAASDGPWSVTRLREHRAALTAAIAALPSGAARSGHRSAAD
ncbi:TetR family transcriptional regulator [Lacisediminihabitans profunda]|uniref:Helix-turn-helix transcriptional regulator n=1 Tax=Lacisediminihabitans profunda TaxID=2594790 RepID=A0A5C8UP52_9MICO|nr:TetR family transcriptional regulator [Lacisediminihabitans profunda]TXN30048.1 helix-turn-helix transcriptional regulator [Lacisediminihabitans profunda]